VGGWCGGRLEKAGDRKVVDSHQGESHGREFHGKPRLMMMITMMINLIL
jgi:hypothetical protein